MHARGGAWGLGQGAVKVGEGTVYGMVCDVACGMGQGAVATMGANRAGGLVNQTNQRVVPQGVEQAGTTHKQRKVP